MRNENGNNIPKLTGYSKNSLRGKYIGIKAYIKKQRLQPNLISQGKKKMKPKVSRRKERARHI